MTFCGDECLAKMREFALGLMEIPDDEEPPF
jgi:hypothetical protein